MSVPYHNPKNVPTAGKGWRFRVKGEPIADDMMRWIPDHEVWVVTFGYLPDEKDTYRTRSPLPEPYIFADEAYHRGVEEGLKAGKHLIFRPKEGHYSSEWTGMYPPDGFHWDRYDYKIADEPREEEKCGNCNGTGFLGHYSCELCNPQPQKQEPTESELFEAWWENEAVPIYGKASHLKRYFKVSWMARAGLDK